MADSTITRADLIQRLRDWPATGGRADAFSAAFVGDLMSEAADALAAAYGTKRAPSHTGACLGLDGMSVNLRYRDGSAEFVTNEDNSDVVEEDGRRLYIARLPVSEVFALRQWLIDCLPEQLADVGLAPGGAR
jgi:hypothetical protein